ncbi:hypothetical protein CYMTET_36598 [Cymbomonas tetramitiformis]|uniref:CSC1/OSCA1-like 7TM region domain-containing protein n=1 Tax=Cymbomonas tetramitiformis TaxID=36881 RepID=A0AAE0F6V1_9CHLO|nr:hypothetical protein CYMTET_36598 [Cymbomonas tetramitiformis]
MCQRIEDDGNGWCGGTGFGAVLQYLLEQEKQKARNDSIDSQTSELAAEDESSTLDKARESFNLRFVSFAIAAVVVVMNIIITTAIRKLNMHEAYKTRSDKQMNFILKLTAGHLLNSVFVPIMVADPSYWYVRGGFVEQAFYIQLVNAVLPDIVQLLRVRYHINTIYLAKFAKTQSQMDVLHAPEEFSIAERYSNILKTFGLATFFGPLLPCSYCIGLVGVTFSYFTDKYMALRVCAKPDHLNQDVVLAFNRMLLFIAVIQYLICYFRYFDGDDNFVPVFVMGLIFGVTYTVFPIQKIFGIKVDEELEDGGTGGVSWEECMKFPEGCAREDINGIHSHGLEVYAPRLPEYCLEDFKQRVYDEYKLPPRVLPANPALLHGQGNDAGGAATMPPPSVKAPPMGYGFSQPLPPPLPVVAMAAEPPRQVPPPARAFQAMPAQPAPVSTLPPMPMPMQQSAPTTLPSEYSYNYPVPPPAFPPSAEAPTAYPTGMNPSLNQHN